MKNKDLSIKANQIGDLKGGNSIMNRKKPLVFAVLMWAIFEVIAVVLWLSKNNLFYLFNFSYIGA